VAPERGSITSGKLFAAGVVCAVAALVLIDLRYIDEWAGGTQLAIAAAGSGIVLALAIRGPRPVEPAVDRSALLIAGLVLVGFALGHLAEVLGDEDDPETSVIAAALVFAALAAVLGVWRRSAASVLLAALAVGVATIAFVAQIEDSEELEPFRWAASAYFSVFWIGGVALRAAGDRRHGPQLVNAAGLALIAFAIVGGGALAFDGSYGLERGWEAVLVVGSLLTLAVGLLFRERGPAWIGVVALAMTLVTVSGEGDDTPTLVGWPLFLVAAAALLIAAAAVHARR
jgi:peptidoglycan/LPS O-acetylase OafA/YrhL